MIEPENVFDRFISTGQTGMGIDLTTVGKGARLDPAGSARGLFCHRFRRSIFRLPLAREQQSQIA